MFRIIRIVLTEDENGKFGDVRRQLVRFFYAVQIKHLLEDFPRSDARLADC